MNRFCYVRQSNIRALGMRTLFLLHIAQKFIKSTSTFHTRIEDQAKRETIKKQLLAVCLQNVSCKANCRTLKTEAVSSSEMSADFHRTNQPQVPEGITFIATSARTSGLSVTKIL